MPGLLNALKNKRRHLLIFLPIIILIMGFSYSVNALDVSISAQVPSSTSPEELQSSITFKGLAYPFSLVYVKSGQELMQLLIADSRAKFSVTKQIDPNTYIFKIYGRDLFGVRGRKTKYIMTITEGTSITLSGIFLPPTVEANRRTLPKGKKIKFFGTTAPKKRVIIKIHSTEVLSVRAFSNNRGRWSRHILADNLSLGKHTAKVKAKKKNGATSIFSKEIKFVVTKKPVLSACDLALDADINCDGAVNALDLSIMQMYWGKEVAPSVRADINKDGKVDILDFAELMFYWTD